jgi:drug/metabolite transporter (DMT)-like permease
MNAVTILAYAAVYIIWGSTYYFIRIAIETIPVFHLVGLRFFVAGVVTLIVAFLLGAFKNPPTFRQIAASTGIGILMLLFGNGVVCYAEQRVSSYLTALLLSTSPFTVMLFDKVFFKKKISRAAWIGIICGMLGVAVLLYSPGTKIQGDAFFEALVMVAMVSWALGTSISSHSGLPKNIFVNSGIQFVATGIVGSVIAQHTVPWQSVNWQAVSGASWFGLFYLAILGNIGMYAYAYLIKHEPNSRIVTHSFVNPLVAVFFGMVIGKEAGVPFLVPGIAFILAGLFLTFYGGKIRAAIFFKKIE